jgi:hypothetical protein
MAIALAKDRLTRQEITDWEIESEAKEAIAHKLKTNLPEGLQGLAPC